MPTRALKWFLWQLAHANLLLAISTAGAVYVVNLVLGLPQELDLVLMAFFVTFAIYNFNRHTDRGEDRINHPERVRFIQKYGKGLVLLSVFVYFIAILLSLKGGRGAQLIVLLPLIVVILYSIKWLPKNSHTTKRLKEMFIVKNFIVSLTWSGAVTFLPILYFEARVSPLAIAMWVFLFFRFFINTVVFDLRDIKGDKMEDIHSLPVVLGYNKTRNILHTLNIGVGIIFLVIALFGSLPAITVPLMFSTIYSFAYLIYLRYKRNIRFVCDVVVDGEYFALAAFYWLITPYLA